MQVYAHFHTDQNGVDYRWRTLLRFGSSWERIGTVFIQHPGTMRPVAPVTDPLTKEALEAFRLNERGDWQEFKPCPTMRAIEQLFTERNGGRPLEGILQVFHLTNVCGGEKKTRAYEEAYAHTATLDNTQLVPPIYLGWGDISKTPALRPIAVQAYLLTRAPAFDQHYLVPYFDHNYFVHPLLLMTTGKDSFESVLTRRCFIANTTKPEGINELLTRHHNDVKNASRSQELLEFLPSFSIAPFAAPQRRTANGIALTAPCGIQIEIYCEDENFEVFLFHESKHIDKACDLSGVAAAHGFKADVHNELRSFVKLVPLDFVESVYTDIQAVASALR